MTAVRWAGLAALVVAATVAQAVVFPYVAVEGVVPNLALVVVVVAAFSRGPEFAAVLGFCAGLLLDLAPPADHVAGRWALALVVVGYLAGRVRHDAGTSPLAAVVTVAASSFVGTSIFVLSGMVLHDPDVPVVEALRVVPVAVAYDVLVTPFVLPLVMWLFRRLRTREIAY